ncbi:MAG: hypothetical protein HN353_07410 [Bdellovibrionales bacterium]|nr:hypothetical protein [Bdellovibrionales bacterium]MBT3526638.1 hypothetical protein [Bdellovibrionales bacterium]MBT7667990.1 hypothetical protein [Bdellovibrionales bacterium]MBT7766245.1 hypothetical protein [Bdellovibrionales bacterium]
MNDVKYNNEDPIELAPGVFHLGVSDEKNSFANIPYLITSGDEAMVIDPGSAVPEFYQVVLTKLKKALNGDLKRIKHVVVQHQDPDLCAAIPLLEKELEPDYQLHAPLEARVILQHYGMKQKSSTLDEGNQITFGQGRTLTFVMTPYCHFIGSMVSYDHQSKVLFSSDAFGGFSDQNNLYATQHYPVQLESFLGEYLGSKRALEYALKRIEQVDKLYGIEMICPQHGCVIPKELISEYIAFAHKLKVGAQIDALAKINGITLSNN